MPVLLLNMNNVEDCDIDDGDGVNINNDDCDIVDCDNKDFKINVNVFVIFI